MPSLRTSALVDDTTIYRTSVTTLVFPQSSASPWLGGVSLDMFNGTIGERVGSYPPPPPPRFSNPLLLLSQGRPLDQGRLPLVRRRLVRIRRERRWKARFRSLHHSRHGQRSASSRTPRQALDS